MAVEPQSVPLGDLVHSQDQAVTDCQKNIAHWEKVRNDYTALQDRLQTLPSKLSHEVMVPLSAMAFVPGRLVRTNEVTVLLGDGWFARCSTSQAGALVRHRNAHVEHTIKDLQKMFDNLTSHMDFSRELKKVEEEGGFRDIRESMPLEYASSKGHARVAHTPKHRKTMHGESKNYMLPLPVEGVSSSDRQLTEMEDSLWARLDELERLEAERREVDNEGYTLCNTQHDVEVSERPMEGAPSGQSVLNERPGEIDLGCTVKQGEKHPLVVPGTNDESDSEEIPTIYFTHTVEPKKVRIDTGRNTTLKFGRPPRRRRSSGCGSNETAEAIPRVRTPADVLRPSVPRKSILKSRSRESSECIDAESVDVSERSKEPPWDCSRDEQPVGSARDSGNSRSFPSPGRPSPFSGTVVERSPLTTNAPISMAQTNEDPGGTKSHAETEVPSRPVSKFKASRTKAH
uniref:unconventional prefoldin RPB5 interactor-like isoform X2 n=1 Tax=Myxine glutinosa TaxID=7769 RepID=UPI00358FC9E8